MLIDQRQRRWIGTTTIVAALALALYVYLSRTSPGGLTGGSLVGMWYGLIGSGLMVFAGLLSALRKVPSWWWLGARKTWLRGHVWLGLLSFVFLLCHSGFRWGGALEIALWIVVGLTLLTGIYGLILQQILPRLLTARFPNEPPYEQIPHLCSVLRHKADEELAKIVTDPALGDSARQEIAKVYQKDVRPFFQDRYLRTAALARPLQAELLFTSLGQLIGDTAARQPLHQLQAYCTERRQWGELERYYFLLHSWLLVHVPLSVLILVLGVAHVAASLYY
jgi:hypothetical protein